MTIEQVLECDPSELESLSDATLTEKLSHYFTVTRPPDKLPATGPKAATAQQMEMVEKLTKLAQISKATGIDLSGVMKIVSKNK